MRKHYCLFFIVCLNSGMAIFAQEWTDRDSLWLQRIENGTEQIRLNEATQKAIQSGTLIRDPLAPIQLKSSPLEMPLVKSFEGITTPTTSLKPQDVSPGVYKIYVQQLVKDTLPVIRKEATAFSTKIIAELKTLDATTPRKATVDDKFTIRSGATGIYSEDNIDARHIGPPAAYNFEDILRTIFWPSHRAKMRNAKNANAWKTYNEY